LNDQDSNLANAVSTPAVLLCLLGGFRLLRRGLPVAIKSHGKTEALLTSLGLAPLQGVVREVLLAAVWPDSELTLAGHALNSTVHRVRLLLGDALGGASPVVQSDGRYRLNQQAGVRVDVPLFKALVAQGDRDAQVDPAAGMPSYVHALRP